MIYCTFDEYTAQGGTLTEPLFNVWAERASRRIDRMTMGRAAFAQNEETRQGLADACARMADLLAKAANSDLRAASGLTGATTDGYSENYGADADRSAAVRQACRQALADALGNDPENLLYCGV